MPTVKLEIELDSEVYPELYAALAAVRSARARGERLRQLAASGLVWEMVRLRGPVAMGPPAGDEVTRPAPEPPLPVALREVKTPRPPRAPAERRATPRPRAVEARGGDFIDLAIDAPPVPSPLPVDADGVARELPVLLDVVADPDAMPVVVDAPAEPMPEPVETAPSEHEEDPMLPETIHVASLAQKPASRSRLMRMKEKGLFKNG